MARSVRFPTSTQVMISWFVSSSPALSSRPLAQSLLWILCLLLSLTLPHCHAYSLFLSRINKHFCKKRKKRDTWVAQLVKQRTSAQVMISPFVSLSPTPGPVLTAQSLEPVSDSVSPTLSASPLLVLFLSLSQN